MAIQGVLRTAESLTKLNEIEKFNGISTKTSQIEKMALAIKGLTKENALLLLTNKNVNIEDQKTILIKAGVITKEEAETMAIFSNTTATTANTVAKKANLKVTNLLKVAYTKLIANKSHIH